MKITKKEKKKIEDKIFYFFNQDFSIKEISEKLKISERKVYKTLEKVK